VFRVADGSRRGLVSYEDFVVFETRSSAPTSKHAETNVARTVLKRVCLLFVPECD